MVPIAQSMRPPLRLRSELNRALLLVANHAYAEAVADVEANSDPRQAAYLAANAETLRCRVSRLRVELRASRIVI